MEIIVFIPALLMAMSVFGAFSMLLKVKDEIFDAPSLVKFFGLQIFFPRYLTEQGKVYRLRYWRLFGLSFIYGLISMVLLLLLVPEFRQEFNWS